MKRKHTPRPGLRIPEVAEQGFVASRFVVKDELICPAGEVLRQLDHVLLRLHVDAAERVSRGLRFYNTSRPTTNK
jgi:hypothetical protein